MRGQYISLCAVSFISLSVVSIISLSVVSTMNGTGMLLVEWPGEECPKRLVLCLAQKWFVCVKYSEWSTFVASMASTVNDSGEVYS